MISVSRKWELHHLETLKVEFMILKVEKDIAETDESRIWRNFDEIFDEILKIKLFLGKDAL